MNYSQSSNTPTEIVVGIIGPIGCNRELVINTIKKLAKHYSYESEVIKLSDIIISYTNVNVIGYDQYDRVVKLMDAGNDLRNSTSDNSILGKMAAIKISKQRENHKKPVIYIINSLKHPEEVAVLRDIYGNGFYLFAIHSSEKTRDVFLKKECHIDSDKQRKELIERDKDEHLGYGQRTSAAFHLADFFVTENGDNKKIWNSLERFFDLIFGDPFRTPTFQEYAMFMAYASSIKSADLSRQVGAVITHLDDILSTGANECPKPYGGTYWPEFNEKNNEISDVKGGRDYTRGCDHNAHEKQQIINRLKSNMPKKEADILDENIANSGLQDITEYGRVVHAEMDAILGCARRGVSCLGTIMFCSTFPCHNCAKHIVASGIKKVVYIEPYPKSKAFDMHDDSISDNPNDKSGKVIFRPFVGVGPRQYINFFSLHLSMGGKISRKEKGTAIKAAWERKNAVPRLKLHPVSYLEIEGVIEEEIEKLNLE